MTGDWTFQGSLDGITTVSLEVKLREPMTLEGAVEHLAAVAVVEATGRRNYAPVVREDYCNKCGITHSILAKCGRDV